MNLDVPSISSSAYGASTSTFALGNTGIGQIADAKAQGVPAMMLARALPQHNFPNQFPQQQEQAMAQAPTRRLVQVFIADPDENVPLDKALLYTGSQKLTDATDQELYFEIDIKAILKTHNAARIQLVNKKVKERIEYLEPARVRDLRMVVVNVATF